MPITLPQLDSEIWFPPIQQALREPNGLIAFGGDLRPERILAAYRRGIFPWYQEGEPILWWSPDPRGVLFLEQLHISRSMRKVLLQADFEIRMDSDFAAVMRGCAAYTEKRTGTWITPAMYNAYCDLHALGHAHSIEVWRDDKLIGGLYGLAIGGIFCGESMFSRSENASKIALIKLSQQLQQWGFAVIDSQLGSDHLRSMGAREITRTHYLQLLEQHADTELPVNGVTWKFTGIE
ncbi:MAG: leucyl/phenylalanyl-tRNA--protein transferase [Verrucomicrobiaceae bacterium]|nr:leucyl/phenylalanyl-tRNA--protein transferase [Verrucomicrobiaceae bacterium]